jgi:hypothetical protein
MNHLVCHRAGPRILDDGILLWRGLSWLFSLIISVFARKWVSRAYLRSCRRIRWRSRWRWAWVDRLDVMLDYVFSGDRLGCERWIFWDVHPWYSSSVYSAMIIVISFFVIFCIIFSLTIFLLFPNWLSIPVIVW